MDPSLGHRLQQGCAALQVPIDARQQAQLLEYLALLLRWNRAYNLTAVRDPAAMVTRHLLDSLAIAHHIAGARCIDVGSGAGLPGVPLAIAFPDRAQHLLDSNGKKTRFLFQVKTALGLANMVVHQARVEAFQPDAPYDTVVSRAFASLRVMVRDCRHLLAPSGRLLAMKGACPADELAEVRAECAALQVHALAVPGLAEQRQLVEMVPLPPARQSQTPSQGQNL